MSSDEFTSLIIGKTERSATSQNNIVQKALTHARLVAAGMQSLAHQTLVQFNALG